MRADASRAKSVTHFVTRGQLGLPFCNKNPSSVNVGFCQLVRRAPWGHRSVATKWGSQPLGSNLNGDAKALNPYPDPSPMWAPRAKVLWNEHPLMFLVVAGYL